MNIKPGYKTTEFWGKLFAQFATLGFTIAAVSGSDVSSDQRATIITSGTALITGIEGIYHLVRGLVKSRHSSATATGSGEKRHDISDLLHANPEK